MNVDVQTLKDNSFQDLLRQLQTDLVALADTEKKLVKAELSQKWEEGKKQAALLMVALAFSLLAGICLTASAVLALSTAIAPWLSALIVGGVLLVGCAAAFAKVKAAAESFTPKLEHTVENVTRDVKTIGEVAR